MVRKNAPVWVAGFLLLALTACEQGWDMNNAGGPVVAAQATAVDPDPAALRMARAAEQATSALNKMSQIEAFRSPMPNDSGMNFGHPALQQPTTITWTGPVEQITRMLAEMAGFTFKTAGKAPPVPLVVTVNAYQQPIGAILRDIGFQAGRRADVIVDLGNQIVNLRYAPTDGLIH